MSELEKIIREEVREGFMDNFKQGRQRGKMRGLKRRGLVKDKKSPGDVLDLPGGSDKNDLTGKTYAELTQIWTDNGGEVDHRGRPVEISAAGKKTVLPLDSLAQKLKAMRKV